MYRTPRKRKAATVLVRTPTSKRRLFTPSRPPVLSRSVNVVRGRGPVAARTFAKLKYNTQIASNGTTGDHTWNLNSIFDPDLTGTGHQPYGYDTYATLYNRYRVWKVKVIAEVASTSNNYLGLAALMANNVVGAESNTSLAFERPNAISKMWSQGFPARFKSTYKLWDVTGVSKAEYKDDRFQAVFGASPSESIILHTLHADSTGAAPTANTCAWNITFIFYVEMWDPKELSQS